VIRINLLAPEIKRCPSCGCETEEGFDGGSDTLYEFCERVTYLRRWSIDGRLVVPLDAILVAGPGPEPWRCDFFRAPPRWLMAALAEEQAPAEGARP
jgi:hypothetical protein